MNLPLLRELMEDENLFIVLWIDGYVDGGSGYCDDGSGLTFPTNSFESSSIKDCRLACNNLESCIAFDIHNHNQHNNKEYCNLRFLSLGLAEAASEKSGYGMWPQPHMKDKSCRNDCKSTIVGTGRNEGRCYVKIQGY